MLVLLCKLASLSKVMRSKKRFRSLHNSTHILLFKGISNGLATDLNTSQFLELGGSISFASGYKSNKISAVMRSELRWTTTQIAFKWCSDSRAKFRDSSVADIKFASNISRG